MPIRFTASLAGTATTTLVLLLVQLHIDSQSLLAVASVGAVA